MGIVSKGKGLFSNPLLLMAVLLVLWGSFATISKFALRTMDSFQVQFYMFAAAVICMTLNLLFKGRMKALLNISSKDWVKLLLYGIPSYLYYLLYILALKMIPAIEASMLNYMFPILLVVLSVPIHGERLNRSIVTAMLFGLLGMIFIVTNGDFSSIKLSNLYGDLLAFGGALCWALFSNLGKKSQVPSDLSNYVYALVAFALSIAAILLFSKFILPDAGSLGWASMLGVSNIVIAYYLWFRGLRVFSSSLIASMTFITPFITIVFIVIFLGEQLTVWQCIGFLSIVVGIVIQVRSERKSTIMSPLAKTG